MVTARRVVLVCVMLAFDFYPGNTQRNVLLLHGLFGSAKNFASLAEALTSLAQVYAYDARNHGRSYHTATHNLADLTADLRQFIVEHKIENPILIGHSLGGMTAMDYVRAHAGAQVRGGAQAAVRALVVLDIAPRTYPLGHAQEIAAQKIDISEFKSRREIDQVMAEILPNKTLRQFLAMNIGRDEAGHYYWQNNIDAIEHSHSRTVFPPYENPMYSGPCLAVRGLKSDYVNNADVQLMRAAFPGIEFHDFEDAEHWLHYTHQARLLELLKPFLAKI